MFLCTQYTKYESEEMLKMKGAKFQKYSEAFFALFKTDEAIVLVKLNQVNGLLPYLNKKVFSEI